MIDETKATVDEIRALVEFSKGLVVKRQEEADAAEVEVIRLISPSGINADAGTRNWVQQPVFVALDASSTILPKRRGGWVGVRLGYASQGAVDGNGHVWVHEVTPEYDIWSNKTSPGSAPLVTGMIGTDWPRVPIPATECWVDPALKRTFVERQGWYDSKSGDTTLLAPWTNGVPLFTGVNPPPVRTLPGLGSVIRSPQEYVAVKLIYESGKASLPPQDQVSYKNAIENFEEPSDWEDRRQPQFTLTDSGVIYLDGNGQPVENPLRVVRVKYQGEYNDYYRSLVRDFDVDLVTARTAEQFEAITYSYTAGLTTAQIRQFMDTHAECCRVFKRTMYNQAYEGDAKYLDFCRLYINWMTIVRMINERMTGFGDVEKMSAYDVTNMLYSFGMYQFDSLPLTYKRRFVKSIERILSNKGTTQVFEDILGLFGLKGDVTIWKYYLVKYFPIKSLRFTFPRLPSVGERVYLGFGTGESISGSSVGQLITLLSGSQLVNRATQVSERVIEVYANVDADTRPVRAWVTNPFGAEEDAAVSEGLEDWSQPDVGFLRADIHDQQAELSIAARDLSYIEDYEDFVLPDPTWQVNRTDARQVDFSVLQTKYFSISAALDVSRNSMALSMLWNTLKDAEVRGRGGSIILPTTIGSGVKTLTLFQGMVAMLILTLWRFGAEDIIPHGESGVSTVLAARTDGAPFPNEDTLLPYPVQVARVADAPDPLNVDSVVDILDRNLRLMDNVQKELAEYGKSAKYSTENLTQVQEYERVRQLWTHKFVSSYQTAAFGPYGTYIEWLQEVNPDLAEWVKEQDTAGNYDEAVLMLVAAIEDALDSDEFSFALSFGSSTTILTYVERMLRFFKSYTVDLRRVSIFMAVDDPANDGLHLLNMLSGWNTNFSLVDSPLRLRGVPVPKSSLQRQDWLNVDMVEEVVRKIQQVAIREDASLREMIGGLTLGFQLDIKDGASGPDQPRANGQDSWVWAVAVALVRMSHLHSINVKDAFQVGRATANEVYEDPFVDELLEVLNVKRGDLVDSSASGEQDSEVARPGMRDGVSVLVAPSRSEAITVVRSGRYQRPGSGGLDDPYEIVDPSPKLWTADSMSIRTDENKGLADGLVVETN